jgi:hypothetical protein
VSVTAVHYAKTQNAIAGIVRRRVCVCTFGTPGTGVADK